MKTQHVFSASAAAVLAMTMAAFALSPQSSSSAPAGQSQTQSSRQSETPVTLVGCVMRETDYRKANNSGRGGTLGTGLGSGDEFVLVNASKVASGATPSAAAGDCSATGAGEAYELSGSREKGLAKYVGRRVEVSGLLKEAKTEAAPGGAQKPTGGFDPLNRDLKLFEVDVTQVRELPAGQSAAAPPAQAAPPAPSPATPARPAQPEPQARPAQPEPQPSPSPAPRQQLPRTASSVALTGLFGLLSAASGLILRRRG